MRQSDGQPPCTRDEPFELSERRDEFALLVNALNRLEGQTEQVRSVSVADNRYRYPLALALALLVFDIIITVRVIKP